MRNKRVRTVAPNREKSFVGLVGEYARKRGEPSVCFGMTADRAVALCVLPRSTCVRPGLLALAAMALSLIALALTPTAFAQNAGNDATIEEVVVTGSYLKRTAADSPSPLSVITSADVEDLGVADIAELIQSMPWQSGSQTRATTFSGDGADGRNSVNLRNLGHGSTLVLVNGKRNVASWYNPRGNASVNVNALIPSIAMERLEVVKDGASVLYGSDAVAGVVNFITKSNFEGFDFKYQISTDGETRKGTTNHGEILYGVQGDRGGIVVSASVLKRSPITIGDRYDRFGGSSASSTGQPGRFKPHPKDEIVWAGHGLKPGESVVDAKGNPKFPRDPLGKSYGQADVDCEKAAKLDGEGGTLGTVYGNLICAYDFGSFFAMQAKEDLRQFHVTGHYDLSDTLQTYVEFASGRSKFDRQNSLNPNALALTIPKTNPGAVEDAYRRGIEPIRTINITRMIGGTASQSKEDREISTFSNANRLDMRMVLGTVWDFDISGKAWSLDASFTASEHNQAYSQVQDTLSSHYRLALNGLGGPNCDPVNGTPGEGNLAYAASGGDFNAGKCYYFNPYGNSRVSRDGTKQTDLKLKNPKELYQYMLGRATSDSEFRQNVWDVVASGDLWEMKNGSVQLAVGMQLREDNAEVVFDAAANTNNLDFAYGAQDWQGKLSTMAFFAEIGVPITDTLDINVAGRYEKIDEISADTVDPKISALWQPTDSLNFRASYSGSFRVPSAQQLFGSITTVANETDYTGESAFKPSITRGNPKLKPEKATSWNMGVSFIPQEGALEGLQVDFDYYNYKYKDIITRQSGSNILRADNDQLKTYLKSNPTATIAEAVTAGIGNRKQVIRNEQGVMLRILPDFLNANSATVRGVDITASYSFDNRLGDWRLGMQWAHVLKYEVDVKGSYGKIITYDAVGKYNDRNPVARPLPEKKINGTLNWSRGKHRAFAIVKYIDEVDYEHDIATDSGSSAARYWKQTVTLAHGASTAKKYFTKEIKKFVTLDLQYTYVLGELGILADSTVTLGVQNVFNQEPPWVPVNTGFDATLHDPRGRIFLLRMSGSM